MRHYMYYVPRYVMGRISEPTCSIENGIDRYLLVNKDTKEVPVFGLRTETVLFCLYPSFHIGMPEVRAIRHLHMYNIHRSIRVERGGRSSSIGCTLRLII